MPPFAPGSVSLRLYPHLDLPAAEIVDELRAQAALAAESGFDGVMTSEHHGGFAGYLPEPAAGRRLVPRGDAGGLGGALPAAPPAATRRARRRGDRVARGALSGTRRRRRRVGRAAGRLRHHARADGRSHRAVPGRAHRARRDARRHRARWARRRPRDRRVRGASDPGRERGDGVHRGAARRRARRGRGVRLAVDAGTLPRAHRRVSRRRRHRLVRPHSPRAGWANRRERGSTIRSTCTAATRRPLGDAALGNRRARGLPRRCRRRRSTARRARSAPAPTR